VPELRLENKKFNCYSLRSIGGQVETGGIIGQIKERKLGGKSGIIP